MRVRVRVTALSASAIGSDARGSRVAARHMRSAPSLPQLSSVAPSSAAGPNTSALIGPGQGYG